jgi:hypothetical protein
MHVQLKTSAVARKDKVVVSGQDVCQKRVILRSFRSSEFWNPIRMLSTRLAPCRRESLARDTPCDEVILQIVIYIKFTTSEGHTSPRVSVQSS